MCGRHGRGWAGALLFVVDLHGTGLRTGDVPGLAQRAAVPGIAAVGAQQVSPDGDSAARYISMLPGRRW